MLTQPLILSAFSPVHWFELLIVLTLASLAYFVVFNNFEKHLQTRRRVVKLFIVTGTLAVVGILFGRVTFWGVIALMTAGQIYLHGVYFPKRGINGLTAEPRDKYLEVIKEMKGEK